MNILECVCVCESAHACLLRGQLLDISFSSGLLREVAGAFPMRRAPILPAFHYAPAFTVFKS